MHEGLETKTMTIDARQSANWFMQRASTDKRVLSIMSLLKLAYMSHGWHLEMYDRPMFGNEIQAWQYGPVVSDIYHAFRKQGIRPTNTLANFPVVIDGTVNEFLEQIYGIYGNMPPFRLSKLTHVKGGPWDLSIRMGGLYSTIPDELIKLHFVNISQRSHATV